MIKHASTRISFHQDLARRNNSRRRSLRVLKPKQLTLVALRSLGARTHKQPYWHTTINNNIDLLSSAADCVLIRGFHSLDRTNQHGQNEHAGEQQRTSKRASERASESIGLNNFPRRETNGPNRFGLCFCLIDTQ